MSNCAVYFSVLFHTLGAELGGGGGGVGWGNMSRVVSAVSWLHGFIRLATGQWGGGVSCPWQFILPPICLFEKLNFGCSFYLF